MRFEYENKFRDIIEFQAIHQFCSPVLQGAFLIFTAFIFLTRVNHAPITHAIAEAITWYLVMWLIQFLFNIVYFASRNNHSVLTKHTIEVTDTALIEETKYNKSYFYWNGIVKVISRLGHVAIYVTPHMAHIIPRRIFSSPIQRKEAIALMRSKIET
jgi:hypothetical protein